MDDDRIVYDSSEISSIVSKIKEVVNLVQNDINPLLYNDFYTLQELGFFDSGMDRLKAKTDNVVFLNNKLVSTLDNHDSEMNALEAKHMALFDSNELNVENNESYSGTLLNIEEITLNRKNDGKVILTQYVNEIIPSFSYDKKLEILKRVLNEDDSLLSILTNEKESDILIFQLKNILSDDYSIELSKLTKTEEKELQKTFFEKISDNDTNIFDDVDNNSFLHGLSYFKQVAEKNDTTVTNIIFDEDKQDLFMKTINDLYNSDEIDVLSSNQLASVKSYIEETASNNNINVSEMLSDSKYSSIIKGGIYYDY